MKKRIICQFLKGNGNPLQYSCLENCMDRETWWATVCRVSKTGHNWSNFAHTHTFFYYLVTSPLFRKLVGFIQVSPIENTLCKSYCDKNMCLNCENHSVMSDYLQLLDYTFHGILQARILKKVAFPLSRGSPQPRDWTQVSVIAGGFFTSWAIREAQEYWSV